MSTREIADLLQTAATPGARRREGSNLGRVPLGLLELVASVTITLVFAVAAWKVGTLVILFLALLAACSLLALASPKAFAISVLILSPLPSLGAIFGVAIPLGLDPLDILVVLGTGIALLEARRFPLAGRARLNALIMINLALIVVAWYRTYGEGKFDITTTSFFVKPLLVVAAGVLVIQLLPAESVVRTLAFGMAWTLVIVGLSVVLQRVGLYHVYNQEARTVKQYGGVMLSGNSAGALFSTFAVPTYALLRSIGRARFGTLLLLFTVPVLLITLSRTSMIAFAVSFLLLVLLDRKRLKSIGLALVVVGFAFIWAQTGGRSQLDYILGYSERYGSDTNAMLSGRLFVWDHVVAFLDQGNHWLIGGGINSFVLAGTTGPAYAWNTHNLYLHLLTTGGFVMLAGFVLLAVAFVAVGRGAEPALAVALRIGVLSALVTGLTADPDFFNRMNTWLWILVVATCASASGRWSRAASPARSSSPLLPGPPQPVAGGI